MKGGRKIVQTVKLSLKSFQVPPPKTPPKVRMPLMPKLDANLSNTFKALHLLFKASVFD